MMIVKIYQKTDDFEDRLVDTIENIDEIRDIETDYDLLRNKDLIRRYRKDRYSLVIKE